MKYTVNSTQPRIPTVCFIHAATDEPDQKPSITAAPTSMIVLPSSTGSARYPASRIAATRGNRPGCTSASPMRTPAAAPRMKPSSSNDEWLAQNV